MTVLKARMNGEWVDIMQGGAETVARLDELEADVETASLYDRRFKAPGNYWLPAYPFGAYTTQAYTANTYRMTRMASKVPFNGACFEVTTLLAGTATLAIYDTNEFGMPTVMVGSGTADTSTIGIKVISFSPTIPPGVYWLAIHCTTAVTVRICNTANPIMPSPSTANPVLTAAGNIWWFTATLPNPFSGNPAMSTGMPISYIRVG
jgi:hypothetical protein